MAWLARTIVLSDAIWESSEVACATDGAEKSRERAARRQADAAMQNV